MSRQYRDGDGMAQLTQIVSDLYKDVKLIKAASALPGAQKYASKRKGWTATQEDISGPGGFPDGVPEIVVRDKKGNIRVVNGYTTKPSQFAQRQAYYLDAPKYDHDESVAKGRPWNVGLRPDSGYSWSAGR